MMIAVCQPFQYVCWWHLQWHDTAACKFPSALPVGWKVSNQCAYKSGQYFPHNSKCSVACASNYVPSNANIPSASIACYKGRVLTTPANFQCKKVQPPPAVQPIFLDSHIILESLVAPNDTISPGTGMSGSNPLIVTSDDPVVVSFDASSYTLSFPVPSVNAKVSSGIPILVALLGIYHESCCQWANCLLCVSIIVYYCGQWIFQ